MDFIRVAAKDVKGGTREFYPALLAIESQDLVIRGGQFRAIWDETKGLYDPRMSHVAEIIDRAFVKMVGNQLGPGDTIKKVKDYDNQIFSRLMGLMRNIGDMGPELDQKLVFADQTPTKADAATFKMDYSLSDAPTPAWDELCRVLYDPEERLKFEWAIGSILTGASLQIHKFYVFFGPPGTGKSTILDTIELIFGRHTATFSAAELGSSSASFPLEPFMKNPLVAIDQDADLSRIELNVNLNKITAQDKVMVNAKGKNLFEIHPRSCLFIGTNSPVKITDRKSGLYRRLVDIQPTGNTFEEMEYRRLVAAVKFEVGAIAKHCIDVFNELGPTYLSTYRSVDMMYRTNDVFNFVQDNRLILQQGLTLKQAHKMYVEWCNETDTRNIYKQFQFRDMLKDYFDFFHEQHMVDGTRHRSYFEGLKELEHFTWKGLTPKGPRSWLEMKPNESLFDQIMEDQPAQLSTGDDAHPLKQSWDKVTTKLKDLDTSQEHFVKVPTEHIVIDFDSKDSNGQPSLEACLEEAALWPPTYAEPSRSGDGLHLHYDLDGLDPGSLDPNHGPGVEVKALLGGSSLRRRFTVSNGLPIARISSGLKLKEEKSVIAPQTMASEKGLRALIIRALNKEFNGGYTKPNMDFIQKVLADAVSQGMVYDITDMWEDILAFAMASNNQRGVCLEIALSLPLKSELEHDADSTPELTEPPIAYFDLEVYPNVWMVGYILEEGNEVVVMINPTPSQCEELLTTLRLMGYNNRYYDNHILWAGSLGYSVEAIYDLSQAIIVAGDRNRMFGAAYNAAYGDLYDILSEKHSLKWWQIFLGLPHKEMDIPWDEPVPEERMDDVIDYLKNDVLSTREVAWHRAGDIRARQILAKLSGLAVINTNRQHTEKMIFGSEEPELVYTDLREEFPGYVFDRFAPGKDKSTYKGQKLGEGGWVDAEEGYWEQVGVLDVASMHPHSIIALNLFGKFTPRFKDLMDIRLALKKKDFNKAREISPEIDEYIQDESDAKMLADALKIVINSVYGLTAASFPNKFRDERNVDNIVAKRGALFMVDLKEFVESLGYKVIHVKTDSIKIPNITQEVADQVSEFGKKYGYEFEWEATYDKFVLFNDAVYVARENGQWETKGKQFMHPVIYKTLFSQETILPGDYVEVKQVQKGAMYLVAIESEVRQFVGKFGAFLPVDNGRQLLRIDGEKIAAVAGTKDFLWELADDADRDHLNMVYYQELVDEAMNAIEKYIPYSELVA
jgi:hypothetical protein